MSRGLTTSQRAAAMSGHLQVAPLIDLAFTGGTLRATTAPWDITTSDGLYLALGPLLAIKQVSESAGSFEGLEIGMSGLDAAIVAIAAGEPYQGRIARLLKAYLHSETNTIIDQPVVQFIGRMRVMSISETNDQATVVIQAEHYEAELQKAAPLRLNNADQQRLYPGDRGAEYVEQMVERTLTWPSKELFKR